MRILPTTDPLRWPSISIHIGEIELGCDLSDGGAKTRLNVSTLCFLSHPGAISPMGANLPPSDMRQPSHDYGNETYAPAWTWHIVE